MERECVGLTPGKWTQARCQLVEDFFATCSFHFVLQGEKKNPFSVLKSDFRLLLQMSLNYLALLDSLNKHSITVLSLSILKQRNLAYLKSNLAQDFENLKLIVSWLVAFATRWNSFVYRSLKAGCKWVVTCKLKQNVTWCLYHYTSISLFVFPFSFHWLRQLQEVRIPETKV